MDHIPETGLTIGDQAMPPMPPEKTVRFYTLYTLQGATRVDPVSCDWVADLGATLNMPATAMAIDDIIFDPRKASNGRIVLGMHRPINPSFMTQISADGHVADLLPSDPNASRVAHSSAVVFLDDLNVVAIAKGNTSAPGLDSLATFLDNFAPATNSRWRHEPLLDTAKIAQLRAAKGVTKFSAKFSTARDLFSDDDFGVLGFGDVIADRIGGDVEVRIEIRTQPETSDTVKSKLHGQVLKALDRLGADRGSRPKATALFPNGTTEELNLVAAQLAVSEKLDDAATERATFSDLVELVATVGAECEHRIMQLRKGE